MQPIGPQLPVREPLNRAQRKVAGESPAPATSAAQSVKAPKVDISRPEKSTGGGGQLSVRDVNSSPQPRWAQDAFSTKLHLESQRLFAQSEPRSGHAASRMYERVSKA